MKNGLHVETLAVHAGEPPCPATGALDTPVYMSSTFVIADTDQMAAIFAEEKPGYVYNRYGNPTVKVLEDKMAALEGGEAGVATASGMAAISSAILSWVNSGDHVVAARAIYGAAYNFIDKKLPRMGVERTFLSSSDAREFEKALRPNTKLIYFETPTNPVLQVVDIAALARLGRERGIPTVMDNTFATPVLQRPLDYGVDVVVHSATKYLNGHGDAMGGLIGRSAGLCTTCLPGGPTGLRRYPEPIQCLADLARYSHAAAPHAGELRKCRKNRSFSRITPQGGAGELPRLVVPSRTQSGRKADEGLRSHDQF